MGKNACGSMVYDMEDPEHRDYCLRCAMAWERQWRSDMWVILSVFVISLLAFVFVFLVL